MAGSHTGIPVALESIAEPRIATLLTRAEIAFGEAVRAELLSHERAISAAHPQAIALKREAVGALELKKRARIIWDVYASILEQAQVRAPETLLAEVLNHLPERLRVQADEIFGTNGRTMSGLGTSITYDSLDRAIREVIQDLEYELQLVEVRAHAQGNVSLSALAAPRYSSVLAHWENSTRLQALSEPDWANSVKEAIMAVEAMAKVFVDLPEASLGDCMKAPRIKGKVDPGLVKSIKVLWGFASNAPGVRHAGITPPNITVVEGRFAIDVCMAILHLLLSLDVSAPTALKPPELTEGAR